MSTISSIRSFGVPEGDWQNMLHRFSGRHRGWQVQLETFDRETGERVTSSAAALRSLALDLEDEKNPRINVTVLSGNKEIKYILFRPSQMILTTARQTGDEALTIESLNTETTIRLRRPSLRAKTEKKAS